MAASTQLITDITSVQSNGPSATTTANANAPGGPIMGYPDNVGLALLKLKEAKKLLTTVQSVTDNGTDGANRTLIANVLLSLV